VEQQLEIIIRSALIAPFAGLLAIAIYFGIHYLVDIAHDGRRAKIERICAIAWTATGRNLGVPTAARWARQRLPLRRIAALINAGIDPSQARTPQVTRYSSTDLEALAALRPR
jgi:hypothetical protein